MCPRLNVWNHVLQIAHENRKQRDAGDSIIIYWDICIRARFRTRPPYTTCVAHHHGVCLRATSLSRIPSAWHSVYWSMKQYYLYVPIHAHAFVLCCLKCNCVILRSFPACSFCPLKLYTVCARMIDFILVMNRHSHTSTAVTCGICARTCYATYDMFHSCHTSWTSSPASLCFRFSWAICKTWFQTFNLGHIYFGPDVRATALVVIYCVLSLISGLLKACAHNGCRLCLLKARLWSRLTCMAAIVPNVWCWSHLHIW
jgi:hypothetical protein